MILHHYSTAFPHESLRNKKIQGEIEIRNNQLIRSIIDLSSCMFYLLIEGITHDRIKCDACKDEPIKGIRWQCTNCDSVNLCTLCYMSDKHDINHGFTRIDTAADVTKSSV